MFATSMSYAINSLFSLFIQFAWIFLIIYLIHCSQFDLVVDLKSVTKKFQYSKWYFFSPLCIFPQYFSLILTSQFITKICVHWKGKKTKVTAALMNCSICIPTFTRNGSWHRAWAVQKDFLMSMDFQFLKSFKFFSFSKKSFF